MFQLVKCFPDEYEQLRFIYSSHIFKKARQKCMDCESQHLGGGEWWILKVHWPAHLVYLASSRLVRALSQNQTKTKQPKTKQNKTKQNKTKQNKKPRWTRWTLNHFSGTSPEHAIMHTREREGAHIHAHKHTHAHSRTLMHVHIHKHN